MGGDPVKAEGSGERGLVDDDELAGLEVGAPAVVVVEPLGGVLTRDAEIVGEDLGCGGTRGETDDGASSMLLGPGPVEGAHRGGFAGSGRADEQVNLAPGDGDLGDGLGLLGAEPVPFEGLLGDGVDDVDVDGRAAGGGGALEEPVLCGEQLLGGEHDRVPRAEPAGAVVPQERFGGRGQLRWGQAQGAELGCVHDQAGDSLSIGRGGEAPTDHLARGFGV